MFLRANFVDIYLQGMRDRSMRNGTEFSREIQLTDWSTAGNLSNRPSGVQIPRDICTRLKGYLCSTKCSWIINNEYPRRDKSSVSFADGWMRKLRKFFSQIIRLPHVQAVFSKLG